MWPDWTIIDPDQSNIGYEYEPLESDASRAASSARLTEQVR
jgi:hypothetical protein